MVTFSHGASSDLKELLQTIHHIKKVTKNQYLFQEGGVSNELYMIIKGKIQVSKIIPDGRELTLRVCSDGEIVGEMALFSDNPRHMLNAKVIEDGEVAIIFKNELEEKLSLNSGLALEFMKWITDHYRKTQAKFRDLLLHGKKGALYSTLIRLSNSYGIQTPAGIVIDLPMTNQELANFCGTSREVVNRMLSELRKNNVLSIEKGQIIIHDLEYLKIEIDCENCGIDICNIE